MDLLFFINIYKSFHKKIHMKLQESMYNLNIQKVIHFFGNYKNYQEKKNYTILVMHLRNYL